MRIGEELTQGILSTRQGEIMELSEEEPEGPYVYLVALLPVPPLPEPASAKAEGLALVVAGKTGEDGQWGYLAVEKDSKQEIAAYLYDDCKVDVGRWYWLRLKTES